jgi:hypothetical protein
MRFRSELLQPLPGNGSEATLTEIYDVYVTSDGRVKAEVTSSETFSTKTSLH